MASVVREGLLCIYSTSGRVLTLSAGELIATFNLGDTGSFPVPGIYSAGDSVNISGNLAGDQTLRFGPAHYNNKNYSQLWYEGVLAFTAKPFVLPPSSTVSISLHTPFTFTGNLKAYESNNISGGGGPAVFDLDLTGKGQATAIFSASNNNARSVMTLLYYFTPCHGFSLCNWLRCRFSR